MQYSEYARRIGQSFGKWLRFKPLRDWMRRLEEEDLANAPTIAGPCGDEAVKSIRFDYFKNRLEHTLTFTHQATRHIYIVNGAVLAMTYFVIAAPAGARVPVDVQLWGPPVLLVILGVVNVAHAGLLFFQARWYRILDKGFAEAAGIGTRPTLHDVGGWGTHRTYIALHVALAIIIFIIAVVLLFIAARIR